MAGSVRRAIVRTLSATLSAPLLLLAAPLAADDGAYDSATWYIVGGTEEVPEFGVPVGGNPPGFRADLSVTFSRVSAGDVIPFTSGATSPRAVGGDGQAFVVSGSYDFQTGTLVTPRIVGGVGLNYSGSQFGGGAAASDPTDRGGVAPTAHIGFGADFDLGNTLAVSAEYRAFYLGESEAAGQLGESRLDQKFTVGAKIRF